MVLLALPLAFTLGTSAPPEPSATLRAVLLEQLQTTHNKKDWFVPAMAAVEGLTAEQASWRDGKGNHSVGQLAAHLVFWNRQQLAKFNDKPPESFSGDNNETFERFDAAKWTQIKNDLDQVLSDWEKAIQGADEAKLEKWASTLAHIGAHNAYHIGQMIYCRKLQGTWDPDKGVK
jgi:uncharacterized damage-inducible protein DinB